MKQPISVFNSRYLIKRILFKAVSEMSNEVSGKVLDFGCGSKPYYSLFSVDEYIGLDMEKSGHNHRGEDIDIYYDGIKIPLDDNSIDYVISVEVFEHIFNLPDIIKEINRILKPGGKLFFTCPFVWIEHEMPFDYARYTHPALIKLLSNNNFDSIDANKGGDFVIVIGQLINVYLSHFDNIIYRILHPIRYFTRFCYGFLYCIINIITMSLSSILPSISSMYLTNIVTAQKTCNVKEIV